METPFTWFGLIPGLRQVPVHVAGALFVSALLTSTAAWVFRRVKHAGDAIYIEDRLTNLLEVLVEWLLNLMQTIIGPHASRYLPLVGTIFVFILTSNLIGLVPGFTPPTININTNAACAIVVLFAYNYYGFKENGLQYLKHFIGPLWGLAILYFPIEIFSQLFRPITLSVRLFGNIFGDHNVVEIFLELVPWGAPIIFMALGIIVSLMQAFVFTLLTIIYISLAVAHEH